MKSQPLGGTRSYILTGGGTGGHVYPAIALAEFILEKEPESRIFFVGARGGAEENIVPAHGYSLETLDIKGLPPGRNPFAYARVLWRLLRAWIAACGILRRSAPRFVVGTGGYASAPLLLAALVLRRLGSWKGILAVHEQNIVPGRFNLWVARWVDFTGTSFPETLRFFPKQKAFWTGYLLRSGMDRPSLTGSAERAEARRALSVPDGAKVVVVFGGSSGARTINRALLQSLPALLAHEDIYVFHATGHPQGNYRPAEEIGAALSKMPTLGAAGQRYRTQPYFQDMETYYRAADLVVSRAGAGSVWEIASANKPAILIPKSNLPGDHQVKNARFLERNGRARVLYEKKDNGSSPTEEDRVDAEVFTNTVLSILYDTQRRQTTKRQPSMPEGAVRFHELLERAFTLTSGERAHTASLASIGLAAPGYDGIETSIEWLPDSRLLKLLERRWKEGKPTPEDEQKYLENRMDRAFASRRWQERNFGIKLAGLTRSGERLPFLLDCVTDRTPAPWIHRLLGGDFRQVGFIRRNALQAVWRIGVVNPSVRQALVLALSDPYFEVRSWAARAVARLMDGIGHDTEIETALRRNLHDRWFEVVVFTLDPLGKISSAPEIVNDLLPLLEHKNWKVQEATVRCFTNLLDRGIVRVSEDIEQRMRRIPMKGLDFFPLFPLEKTWASFQNRRSSPSGDDPELEP